MAKTADSVEVVDVDRDGEEEVVLRNGHLYAVLAPGCGGRLVYLFAHTPAGGVLVIGNPTDDWNWQQELNRYMDRPANHPGALADVGFEHDRYEVSGLGGAGGPAFLEMTNTQAGSPLGGARKSVLLVPGAPALLVGYRLPAGRQSLATEACLSPDYYRLLREGQKPHSYQGETWRGFRNGPTAVWLGRAGDEATSWAEPARAEVGHGRNIRLQAHRSHFHLLIGYGKTDEESCQRLVEKGRGALGTLRRAAASAAVYGA
jgi:starch synthase